MSISNCLRDVACRQKDTINGLRKKNTNLIMNIEEGINLIFMYCT